MQRTDDFKTLKLHPLNIYLTILLVGLSMLFLGTSGAYLYAYFTTDVERAATFPFIFLFNTVFLIGTSWSMEQANKCYRNDDTKGYQTMLATTMGFTLTFLALQFVGWSQMGSLNGMIGSQYLRLLSILHFLHVVGGMPFMIMFLWTAYKRMQEPVSVLIYFSDPEKALKLKLLTTYWHFLDGLWVSLVVLFTLASVLSGPLKALMS